ncbi:MAG: hypothetical protein ACR2FY_03330 [Pirellulaceae bacterium]
MVIAACRRAFVCSLFVAPVILLGSGCSTSSGWRAPWSGWGWGGASSPSATALNITKPSTQAPAPVSTPGQPNRGVAASGGANPSNAYASRETAPGAVHSGNAVAAYPATAQADAYPAQPASTWQPENGGRGEVAPAAGLQVGPYSMQANPASGYSGKAPPRGPAAGAPGYGGREDYRTADQGAAGTYRGAPAGGAAPPENSDEGSSGPVYTEAEGPATATEPSVYGPADETSPAEGAGAAAAGPYSNAEAPAESASPRSYGPPNTVAPAASRPSTSPPASGGAGRAALPAALSSSGGYRPGSTSGGFSGRNADFEQPQNASAPDNSPAGGTTYR